MKNFFDAIAKFFASLFGKKTEPTPVPQPQPTPSAPNDRKPGELEDSSDVPQDTVRTLPVIAVIPDAPGPFADDDKEDAIDSEEPSTPAPEPAPTTPTTPTTGGGTPPTPTPPTTPTTPSTPTTPPTPPPTELKPRFVWCLDNGHGKLQPGKRSPVFDNGNGNIQFFEYEFNRDVVERIIKDLKKHGVKYLDVVPDFNEVGSFLEERVDRANKYKTDLPKIYVSVHSNAGPAATANDWVADSVNGIETWYASNSTKGKKLAAVFQKHLVLKTGLKNRNLKSTAEKPLYVLEKTTMPAILTENGFYNNKKEVKELMKDRVRQKIADAHVEAILEIEKNGIV
jgi:N-acetylmuramoyl-L-alanine amidase